MKRILLLLLTVLLLTGCAGEEAPTAASSTAVPTETEHPGLYVPDSDVEKATDGAVRAYKLEGENYRWAAPYGQDLLLATGAGRLTVLTGEKGVPQNSAVTGTELSESVAALGVTYSCVYYPDKNARELVVLGADLEQSQRIALPEDYQGMPVLAGKTMEVFYCAGQEIRALDPETGISRLVKQQSCQSCQLLGSCFEGRILICENVDTLGQRHVLYVDTATGQTLTSDDQVYRLYTYGDSYFAMRLDGVTQQQIFGTLESTPAQLHIPQTENIYPVLSLGGVAAWEDTQEGTQISFYETATGLRKAQVKLPADVQVVYITSDGAYVWILTAAREGSGQILYRWDADKSPVTDETVYTSVHYTQDAPDEAGLAQCQTRAEELSSRFGVRIQIWQDAMKKLGGYSMKPEYQTQAINQWLDGMAYAMEQFPEDFFAMCAESSASKVVRICLVRSIATGEQTVQFWDNGEASVIMTPGADVYEELVTAIGYVMDNRLALDTWETLVGDGAIVYGQAQPDSPYLEGEKRAFVDAQSMISPLEDRARLFAAAMAQDNDELFTAPMLQTKLLALCQGIREAFGLQKHPQALPWEQYLTQSLAYIEE